MSLYYRLQGEHVVFFGPGTFQKKETLKAHGARFNGVDKSWVVISSETILALAASLGAVGPVGGNSGDATHSVSAKTPHTSPAGDLPPVSKTTQPSDPVQGLTVSQLMAEATSAVTSAFPNPVWVVGEIQNLSRRGENLFFEIGESKDGAHATATVTVKANLWGSSYQFLQRRHSAQKLADLFVDGTKVRFYVRVGLYKDRGQLTVTVEDVDPAFSQGALALARAELLKKLRSLGLDQKNKALMIPAFPFRVALISAATSRAHTDFEHQLTGSNLFPGTLLFIACPMQGDRVPKAVVKCLQIAQDEDVDLIVISRGGGSAADLRWFDGEEIAIAIANSRVPVIAAIGHHDDHCVAEEICHTRQKTPTAAAEFILEIFRQTRTELNEHAHWLATALDREVNQFTRAMSAVQSRLHDVAQLFFHRHRERLNFLAVGLGRAFDVSRERQMATLSRLSSLVFQSVWKTLEELSSSLQRQSYNFDRSVQARFTAASEELAKLEQNLVRVDPTPWLDAGWTQLMQGGKQLVSATFAKKGEKITARLKDGQLLMTLDDIELKVSGGKSP